MGNAAPNTNSPTRTRHTSSAPASTTCCLVHRTRGFSFQSSTTGATTSAPAPSPSHQVNQMPPTSAQRAKPPRVRLITPHVALTVVLTAEDPYVFSLENSRNVEVYLRNEERARPVNRVSRSGQSPDRKKIETSRRDVRIVLARNPPARDAPAGPVSGAG